jgi:hypothetical protein
MECKELANKVVRLLNIYNDQADGPEVHIEFTDGTIFSFCCHTSSSVQAKLYRDAGGEPQVFQRYELPSPDGA